MVQTATIQSTEFSFYRGSAADSLTAVTAGTQAAALALASQTNRITTAVAGASVALPPVVGQAGAWRLQSSPVRVINATAVAILCYPANGSGDTINGLASTVAVTIPAGAVAVFTGATGYPTSKTGNWYALISNGSAGPLGGAFTVVAATGSNSQSGSAAASPGVIVVGTVSGSTRGIRLASPGSGKSYQVFNDTAFNVNVYPATNATISSLSTNTKTTIAAHKASIFLARSTTHYVTDVGA